MTALVALALIALVGNGIGAVLYLRPASPTQVEEAAGAPASPMTVVLLDEPATAGALAE